MTSAQLSFAQDDRPSLYDVSPVYRKAVVDANKVTLEIVEDVTRQAIAEFGTDADKALMDNISFRMTQDWHPYQAYAQGVGENRVISFDIGFISFLHGLITAVQLERTKGVDATDEYLENFYDYVAGDTNQIGDHLSRYFTSQSEVQKFLSDQKIQNEISSILFFSLTGVALHEFCHHKLGHTDVLLTNADSRTLTREQLAKLSEKSIAREISADVCGIDHAVKMGFPPGASYLFANAIGIMQDNIIKRTSQENYMRSHPMSAQRLMSAMKRNEEAMNNFNNLPNLPEEQKFSKAQIEDLSVKMIAALDHLNNIGR